jgi:two-component sensor histidine kinase
MGSNQDHTTVEDLVDEQRVLAAFGEVALRADDLSPLLTEACKLVCQALKTDFAKVVEFIPESQTMLVRAGVGWKPGVINELLLSAAEDSPEGLTLKEGAVISPDIHQERRFAYHHFLKDHGVQAFVNVLILSKARTPYGVLQVDSRSPRHFHQSDIEFLRTYANLLGAAIDRFRVVDDLRAALRHKELLINELNHRVKNTLATVQSITFQTLRNASSPKEATSAIEGRLRALSHAHDVLTRENWEAANLSEIVAQAVEPYRSHGEHRIHVRGSPARLPPRVALSLAMTLQELATNAVKYGALSSPNGEVNVHWEVSQEKDSYNLQIKWEETGGPPVTHERLPRGFGTRLIERTVKQELDGDVQIEFAPTGLVCVLRVPLRGATGSKVSSGSPSC